ncbi:proline-rich transmembrane 1-like [Paramuricea clavata]|uniref:Proline-rich transmembrane 1-like n=1 Tax=Paramuricea clavata TaxID=317549 RepID=A0A6S7HZX6_PARCT|nr:proline-rich transmembrane 1-like [Paramuricea clavata]
MADAPPPPYPGADQGPSYPPGDTTKQPIPPDGSGAPGYPPQPTPGYPPQAGPANPPQAQVAYPAPTGYPPQHTAGYPPQPTTGYPPQPTAGYPPQPTAGYPPQSATGYSIQQGHPGYPQQGYNQGYAPAATGYHPPGQGHIQQPTGHTSTNTNTTVVVTQQPTIATAVVIPYVNDYMGLSIFSCLCCCWCIGLFAIIKSSEARSNYERGNYTQALASATSARNLSYISIFCGIGIFILIIIIASV